MENNEMDGEGNHKLTTSAQAKQNVWYAGNAETHANKTTKK